MKIETITDQNAWQNFVYKLNLNTFLHSLQWIEFNKLQEHPFWQLGLYNDSNELISVALILKITARRGTFLFCPHGPQSQNNENLKECEKELTEWKKYLSKLAKHENCSFFRIQPIAQKNTENQLVFKNAGFRPAPIHMHTELSTVLDITCPLEEVLMKMRKTTRQMIRRSELLVQEKKVELEFFDKITPELFEVYKSTGSRGKFVGYSDKYLEDEYESFAGLNSKLGGSKVKLFAVRYRGQILSWAMVLFTEKRAFYHQGANILNKEIPASYLCQWTGIKLAKELGCISYDFWGVSPLDNPAHPWAKISVFKRGFAGKDVELLHAQDYVLNWKYWLNWVVESYRARKRGFVGS